jgi:tetratricopeptide (TPR) repeat protein
LDRARELYGLSASTPSLLRKALAEARKALLLDARSYGTLVLLGDVLADFDKPDSTGQALKYFDEAIALDPNHPEAYCAKAGLLMYWLNEPKEAERNARKALSLSARNRDAHESLESSYATLIDILMGRKRYAQACWLIRKALRDCPTEFMKDMVEQPLKEIESSDKKVLPGDLSSE